MTSKTKAIIYVLICVGLWALIPIVSKLGQANLDNHQFLFWSSFVSFMAFIIAIVAAKQSKTFLTYKRKDWLSVIFLGFLGTYLYYILLYFGYANVQGLEVLVIQYKLANLYYTSFDFYPQRGISHKTLIRNNFWLYRSFSCVYQRKFF